MSAELTVAKTMCATCPFRPGSKYEELKEYLTRQSQQEARICHSTGDNAINERTGKKSMICRGSRDLQLRMFVAMGFLKEATDEAWAAKWAEMKRKKL